VIRVTADANIYISSFVFAGVPRQFLLAAEAGKFQLAMSPPISAEIQRVLLAKFGWREDAVTAALSQLSGCTTLYHPDQTLDAVPSDPDDNRILECAVANSFGLRVHRHRRYRPSASGKLRFCHHREGCRVHGDAADRLTPPELSTDRRARIKSAGEAAVGNSAA